METAAIAPPQTTGIVLVDHGSRREASNANMMQVAELFLKATHWTIVEPAHMELAEPSIATAIDRCVAQGAELVVVFPYLLAPGRHWENDIPRLAAEAAARHAGLRHLVTAPLGLHELIMQVVNERIDVCLQRVFQGAPPCSVCELSHSNSSPGCARGSAVRH